MAEVNISEYPWPFFHAEVKGLMISAISIVPRVSATSCVTLGKDDGLTPPVSVEGTSLDLLYIGLTAKS